MKSKKLNAIAKVLTLSVVLISSTSIVNAQWDGSSISTKTLGFVQIGDINTYAGANGFRNPSLWIKSYPNSGEAGNSNQQSLAIDNFQDNTSPDFNPIVSVVRRFIQTPGVLDWNFAITGDGKTVIGVEPATVNLSDDFKLFVKDGILTEKVQVMLSSSWPDYVFEPGYNLPSLNEVEQYVKNNKHLPNVPSAAEVSEKGIELGDMNAKLLRKIEELTLYMIDLKKQNNELQQRVINLEK